jgi:ABC-type sugar transport system ATPase subunit
LTGNTSHRSPLLQARGINKAYGHVQALSGVDFDVTHGETVALVGDNGAGKSTFTKIICGALQPDAGEISLDGERVSFGSPGDAAKHGIAVVYQDLALIDTRDVAANVFLGREPGRIFVSRRLMRRESRRVLDELKIGVPSVRTLVGQLSGGQRQTVAIARAVHQGGRLVIMDEPTAALGVQGQRKVLQLIDDLREQGSSVVVISHNLEHVFSVADRIVVLRAGRVAGARRKSEATPEEIVQLIVGAKPVMETTNGG